MTDTSPSSTPAYTAETLLQKLVEMNIPHTTHHHKPVFTVEEANEVDAEIPGAHIKNLFLRDKKKTGLWLLTCLHDTAVDLKALKEVFGARGNLSFCNAEVLWEKLGVKPGSVTPLAVANDVDGVVQAYVDERVFDFDIVNPHPLENDKTTSLSPQDLVRFMAETHTAPVVISIPEREV